jgi:hypothetical protein
MRHAGATLVAVLLLFVPSMARAEDEDAAPREERGMDGLCVVNVPAFVVGRFSFDFGTIIAPHVAPTGSLHVQAIIPSPDTTSVNNSLSGFGGELGVRFYTTARRPAGAFVGVYALAGRYYATKAPLDFDHSTPVSSFGGALDLGWSFITPEHTIVALGGGVDYRVAQSDPRTVHVGGLARMFVDGVHPRALVQLGRFF